MWFIEDLVVFEFLFLGFGCGVGGFLMFCGWRNCGVVYFDLVGWVFSEYMWVSGLVLRYFVCVGYCCVRDFLGFGFCVCLGGWVGFLFLGGRWRVGDVGVGGGICWWYWVWVGSGGVDSGVVGVLG